MNRFVYYIVWPAVGGLVFALALISMPKLLSFFPAVNSYFQPVAEPVFSASRSLSFSEAIKKTAPAVVSINSAKNVFREIYINPFEQTWGGIYDKSNSLGSGVIISPDGYLITSYHVVIPEQDGVFPLSEDSTVTLSDGRTVEARIVSLDKENDLALLRIDAENLPYLSATQNRNLEAGDVVLAIGNPRNIGKSVSMGIISALLSHDDSYVIQTDAAINPGNSGGALIDADGNLIGINSTIVSESGGSEGIGFAISADKAFALMDNYIQSGPSGYLGIEVEVDANDRSLLTQRLVGNTEIQGLEVTKIIPNGPAAKAGIFTGDLITAINGKQLNSPQRVTPVLREISDAGPGKEVVVQVLRNNKELLDIPVVLGVGESKISIHLTPVAPEKRLPPPLIN